MVAYALRPARQCSLHTGSVSFDDLISSLISQCDPSVVTGSKESPAGLVPPVPGLRTESPQPVSSTRRRLSTDEMQLREVGKLAVYLRKIQWLQRPRLWALSLAWDLCRGIPTGEVARYQAGCGSHCLPRHIVAGGRLGPVWFATSGPWPVPVSNRVAHVELLLCKGI